ncbi:NAD(P)-binding protein [Streptomyces hainanensis]|uniref:FAD-dependent oxidoreductase n=1 Tax=Streptomyces hainanensis TaxID=402648 RepID=A0A4R4SIM8_9ACTN|nr:NAD(P)-binding protein [Streptomyces hainanensis]TDC62274.1 hypothetical protein E1283_34365 [Streptomyces hainanensis]
MPAVNGCVVVGAGVVGAAVAASLGRRGRRGTVVDQAPAPGVELVTGDRVVALGPTLVRLASGRVPRADAVSPG